MDAGQSGEPNGAGTPAASAGEKSCVAPSPARDAGSCRPGISCCANGARCACKRQGGGAMSDVVPAPGLALRGEALRDVTSAIAAARAFDRERRARRALNVGGGWAVAGMMTLVAAACLGVMWNRPVPQD